MLRFTIVSVVVLANRFVYNAAGVRRLMSPMYVSVFPILRPIKKWTENR